MAKESLGQLLRKLGFKSLGFRAVFLVRLHSVIYQCHELPGGLAVFQAGLATPRAPGLPPKNSGHGLGLTLGINLAQKPGPKSQNRRVLRSLGLEVSGL